LALVRSVCRTRCRRPSADAAHYGRLSDFPQAHRHPPQALSGRIDGGELLPLGVGEIHRSQLGRVVGKAVAIRVHVGKAGREDAPILGD
jgi:hypothetical protein